MTADSATVALASAAQALYSAARSHKHASDQHRRQARTLMRRFDELRRECELAGITLETIDRDPHKEGHSHA